MTEHLAEAIRDAMTEAHATADRRPAMKIRAGGRDHPVLRRWPGGFSLSAADPPCLRGRVTLFEEGRQVGTALVVATGEMDGERAYEFKFATRTRDSAPWPDHVQEEDPAALPPL